MTDKNRYTQRAGRAGRGLALAASMAALLAAMPAGAQQGSSPAPSAPSTLSMLEAMVAGGVITKQQAAAILADAQSRDAAKAATVAQTGQGTPPAPPAVRVQYVPQIVKDEIKAEVKKEVMAKAEAEGWAAPGETPEWTKRIKISGDVRGRYDGTFFPDGNLAGTSVPDSWDFNAVNAGKPMDVSKTPNLANDRYHNVNQDRDRFRIRARIGVDADLGEGVTAGVRLATGSGNSPVSTNQTLGGSGGNFSKYQVWLDRAFLHWDALKDGKTALGLDVGRFDNPFFSTDLIWDGDLGFDGLAAKGRYKATKEVTPFVTVGAFPIYNTDFNLSSNQPDKQASRDRWLFGVQSGADWKVAPDVGMKLAAAYYHFDKISGKQSSPCALWDSSISCDTDDSRPGFAQKGNSYMSLRREIAGRPTGVTGEYQYFGLASGFRELALTGRVDYDGLKPLFSDQPLRVSFDGEFVKNLAFDKKRLSDRSWNNTECGNNSGCRFEGGDTGYLARITVGTPKLAKRWDWNASLAYKYVESDAVVDGLTDSDFGLGGTNLKGFILGGNLALTKNVWTSLRWMSADSIAGSSFSVDTVMLDLTGRF